MPAKGASSDTDSSVDLERLESTLAANRARLNEMRARREEMRQRGTGATPKAKKETEKPEFERRWGDSDEDVSEEKKATAWLKPKAAAPIVPDSVMSSGMLKRMSDSGKNDVPGLGIALTSSNVMHTAPASPNVKPSSSSPFTSNGARTSFSGLSDCFDSSEVPTKVISDSSPQKPTSSSIGSLSPSLATTSNSPRPTNLRSSMLPSFTALPSAHDFSSMPSSPQRVGTDAITTPPDSTSPSPPATPGRGRMGWGGVGSVVEEEFDGVSLSEADVKSARISSNDIGAALPKTLQASPVLDHPATLPATKEAELEFLSGFDVTDEERSRVLGTKASVLNRESIPVNGDSKSGEDDDGYSMEFDEEVEEDVESIVSGPQEGIGVLKRLDHIEPSTGLSLAESIIGTEKVDIDSANSSKDLLRDGNDDNVLPTIGDISQQRDPAVALEVKEKTTASDQKDLDGILPHSEKKIETVITPRLDVSGAQRGFPAKPVVLNAEENVPEGPLKDSTQATTTAAKAITPPDSSTKPVQHSPSKSEPPSRKNSRTDLSAKPVLSSASSAASLGPKGQPYQTFSDFLASNPEVAAELDAGKVKSVEQVTKLVEEEELGGDIKDVQSISVASKRGSVHSQVDFQEALVSTIALEDMQEKPNIVDSVPSSHYDTIARKDIETSKPPPTPPHNRSFIPKGSLSLSKPNGSDRQRPPTTAPTAKSTKKTTPAAAVDRSRKAAVLGRVNQKMAPASRPAVASSSSRTTPGVSPVRPPVARTPSPTRQTRAGAVHGRGGSPSRSPSLRHGDHAFNDGDPSRSPSLRHGKDHAFNDGDESLSSMASKGCLDANALPASTNQPSDASLPSNLAGMWPSDPASALALSLSSNGAPPPSSYPAPTPTSTDAVDASIASMLSTISAQKAEIKSLKARMQPIEMERDRLREEVGFLEKLREQEREAGVGLGGIGYGKGGVDAGGGEIEKLRKEIAEQETLIKGYQTENEKLIDQTKNLKSQLKESERRFSIRVETLQRDLATLRQGGGAGVAQPPIGGSQVLPTTLTAGDTTRLAILAEDLEQQLLAARRDASNRETALQGEIAKLRAQLADAATTIESFRGRSEEEVAALKSRVEEERGRLEGYIVELESRLERETEKVEMALAEVERRDNAIVLSVGREDGGGGKRGRVGAAAGRRVDGDAKKVRELERTVVELQDRLRRSSKGWEGLGTAHGMIEEASYVRHLKDRIKRVEAEREAVEVAWEAKLRALHAESTSLREQYESRLSEVQSQFEAAQAQASQDRIQTLQSTAATSQTRIAELENHIEQILSTYDERLRLATEESTAVIQEREKRKKELTSELEKQRSLFRAKEKALIARIGELEAVVDSQAATLEGLRGERAMAERDLAQRLRERDALVGSYEARITELRGEFHDKVFGGDELKWMEEVKGLRVEVETLRVENVALKSRLEVSEATRQAVHENTIAILKQAQQDSAHLAVTHQERALAMLREDSKAQATAILDAELNRLRKDLAESKVEISRWRTKAEAVAGNEKALSLAKEQEKSLQAAEERMRVLETRVADLTREKEKLDQDLIKARSAWPPDRRRFEEVEISLERAEEGFRRRETELQKMVEDVRRRAEEEVEGVTERFGKLLRRKEEEIRHFRDEVDGLLEGLEELRRVQVYEAGRGRGFLGSLAV
ncbi:hypothetical protein HDU67_004580 [Dinochytrium kinnereticum]|nr:hypothetical protein HDU67_004580 [Dinochytrium kinnereticum]